MVKIESEFNKNNTKFACLSAAGARRVSRILHSKTLRRNITTAETTRVFSSEAEAGLGGQASPTLLLTFLDRKGNSYCTT